MSDHRPIDLHPHPGLGLLEMGAELPTVRTALAPEVVLDRLDALSRQGKLPGFERGRAGLFDVEVFAEPFDRVMISEAERTSAGETLIHLRTRAAKRMPLIYILVTVFTIWPGVWLTHSMLRTYFPGYSFPTWMWYIPVTVLPLPWMARNMIRKSGTLAHESTKEQIARIAEAVGGELVNRPGARA